MRKDFMIEITTANTDTTVHSRTPGRRFELRELTVSNRGIDETRVRLWDGASGEGRLRHDQTLGIETFHLCDLHRRFEYGDVVAQATVVPVSISGWGEEI